MRLVKVGPLVDLETRELSVVLELKDRLEQLDSLDRWEIKEPMVRLDLLEPLDSLVQLVNLGSGETLDSRALQEYPDHQVKLDNQVAQAAQG